jgi:hypothetical protein
VEPDPKHRRWLAPAAVVLLGGFVIASPVGLPCPARAILGLPCPTCGMTRATRLAARGEIAAALAMHPLVGVVVPLLAMYLAVEVGGYVRTGLWGASARIPLGRFLFYGTLALLVGVWAARFFGAFGGPVPA